MDNIQGWQVYARWWERNGFSMVKTRLANSFLLVLPQLSSKCSFSQFFEVFLTVFRMPSG